MLYYVRGSKIKNKIIEMRHDYKDYASFFYLYI